MRTHSIAIVMALGMMLAGAPAPAQNTTALTTALERAQAAYDAALLVLEGARAEHDTARTAREAARDAVPDARATRNTALRTLNQAQADLDAAQAAFEAAPPERRRKLREALIAAQEVLAAAETAHAAAQLAFETAQTTRDLANERYVTAQAALAAAETAHAAAQAVLAAAQQDHDLYAGLAAAEQERDQAQAALAAAQAALAAAEQERDQAQAALATAQAALATAQAALATAEQERDEESAEADRLLSVMDDIALGCLLVENNDGYTVNSTTDGNYKIFPMENNYSIEGEEYIQCRSALSLVVVDLAHPQECVTIYYLDILRRSATIISIEKPYYHSYEIFSTESYNLSSTWSLNLTANLRIAEIRVYPTSFEMSVVLDGAYKNYELDQDLRPSASADPDLALELQRTAKMLLTQMANIESNAPPMEACCPEPDELETIMENFPQTSFTHCLAPPELEEPDFGEF